MLGLREGTWLRLRGESLTLDGLAVGARLFRRGTAPSEITVGSDLSELMSLTPLFDVHQ
ncbi:hypothetical protein [Kribbella rubisoli]|uniref:hypothetical protein n=1 Tax=Kribbella rubisoli TaxID=3075929 RepID=UPI001F54647F|nr:hypothetical protein [Kribbella rubisoli]